MGPPGLWMGPGMIPTLHSPGVMIPGQLGPISRVGLPDMKFFTRIMSITGIPSVMATTISIPASTASIMASAAKGGGTKIMLQLAPVFVTASLTVLKTGTSSIFWPAFPGVTPATTWLPYATHCRVWNCPSRPVIPWTMTRVCLSTNMLTILLRFS